MKEIVNVIALGFAEGVDTLLTKLTNPLPGRVRDYAIIGSTSEPEFIPNALRGIYESPIALLSVPFRNIDEAELEQHVKLIRQLGPAVIVLIDRMDVANYDQGEYERTWMGVASLLLEHGISQACYIPVAIEKGDNIYGRSRSIPWYGGMPLVNTLDALRIPKREDQPLRFVVHDWRGGFVHDDICIIGQVVSGTVAAGDTLRFLPFNIVTEVRQLKQVKQVMEADDKTVLSVTCPVTRGSVGTLLSCALETTESLTASVVMGDWIAADNRGDQMHMRCGTADVICWVKNMDPAVLMPGQHGQVEFITQPLVAVTFRELPALGRITLLRNEKAIGQGIITEVR